MITRIVAILSVSIAISWVIYVLLNQNETLDYIMFGRFVT